MGRQGQLLLPSVEGERLSQLTLGAAPLIRLPRAAKLKEGVASYQADMVATRDVAEPVEVVAVEAVVAVAAVAGAKAEVVAANAEAKAAKAAAAVVATAAAAGASRWAALDVAFEGVLPEVVVALQACFLRMRASTPDRIAKKVLSRVGDAYKNTALCLHRSNGRRTRGSHSHQPEW